MNVINSTSQVSWACAVIGLVLTGISFGTNKWTTVNVNPDILHDQDISLAINILPDVYYSRSFGLFRECFTDPFLKPNQLPDPYYDKRIYPYEDPLSDYCIDFQPEFHKPYNLTVQGADFFRVRMLCIGFYSAGLVIETLGLICVVCGAHRRNGSIPVLVAGVLFWLSALGIISAIILWHKSEEILKEARFLVHNVPNLYNSRNQPEQVNKGSFQTLGWSYTIAWIGAGFILLSAFACSIGSYVHHHGIKRKRRKFKALLRRAQDAVKHQGMPQLRVGWTCADSMGPVAHNGTNAAVVPYYYDHTANSMNYMNTTGYYSFDSVYGYGGYYTTFHVQH